MGNRNLRIRRLVRLVALLLAGAIAGCGHDPKAAAAKAEEFARAAFQAQDLETAYRLLSSDAQQQISKKQLAETLQKMHPIGYPYGIHVTEYEPLPTRGAINVFVLGDGTGEMFNYRLTMDGDRMRGYRVGGMYRYLEGFPASTSRTPVEPAG